MKQVIGRAALVMGLLCLALWEIGCGSGTSASATPPANITLSISPTTATIDYGMTVQFSATVTGSSDTEVTWKASAGSVSSSGFFTAPLSGSANSVTVTATSVADASKSSSAKVNLSGRPAPSGRWQFTGPNGGGTIVSLAQDASHPATVYAGILEGGLFKSVDGGNTWAPLITNTPVDDFPALDVAVENSGSVIYVCARSVFGKSTDRGSTWTVVPFSHFLNSMTVDPFHTGSIYLSMPGSGVLKSTDGGTSWSLLPGSPVVATGSVNGFLHTPLAADPLNQNVVYFGTEHGLYLSKDAGKTWAQSTNGIAGTDLAIRDVAFASGGSSVFALAGDPTSATSDLYESSDGGNSWTALAIGTYGERVVPDPVNTSIIYLHGLQAAVAYKSTDGGQTFAPTTNGLPANPDPMPPPFDWPTGTMIPIVGSPNTFLISVAELGMFRTQDAASSWTFASNGFSAWDAWDLDVDPSSPSTVYLATTTGGIFKSTDTGLTWTNLVFTTASGIAVDPFDGLHLLMIGNNIQPFETHDGGATWQPVSLPSLPGGCIFNSITFNPVQQGNIFLACASTNNYGVLQSIDAGKTYAVTNAGMTTNEVRFVFVNPLNPAIVFASTDVGIFKSVDGGNSWVQKLTISPQESTRQISMDTRSNPPILYASGGWKSADGGETWQVVSGAETSNGSMLLADPSTAGSVFDLDLWSPDEGSTWFPVLNGNGEVGGSIGRMVVTKTTPQVLLMPSPSHSILRFVVGP